MVCLVEEICWEKYVKKSAAHQREDHFHLRGINKYPNPSSSEEGTGYSRWDAALCWPPVLAALLRLDPTGFLDAISGSISANALGPQTSLAKPPLELPRHALFWAIWMTLWADSLRLIHAQLWLPNGTSQRARGYSVQVGAQHWPWLGNIASS